MSPTSYTLITPPTDEPLSVADAKSHLRVINNAEDEQITAIIASARAYCEKHTGRALLTQTRRVTFSAWPCDAMRFRTYQLYGAPLASVEKVEYLAADATTPSEMSPDDYLVLTGDDQPGRVCFPATVPLPALAARPDAVRVTYVCGYPSEAILAAAQPALLTAVKQLVTHFYGPARGAISEVSVNELPFALKSLLEFHRVDGWLT